MRAILRAIKCLMGYHKWVICDNELVDLTQEQWEILESHKAIVVKCEFCGKLHLLQTKEARWEIIEFVIGGARKNSVVVDPGISSFVLKMKPRYVHCGIKKHLNIFQKQTIEKVTYGRHDEDNISGV